MITLSKEIFREYIAFHDNWISNGHWMVNKNIVKNQAIFTNEETIRAWYSYPVNTTKLTDAQVSQALQYNKTTEFVKTDWIWRDKYRLYINIEMFKSNDRLDNVKGYLFLDDKYQKTLQFPDICYAENSVSPAFDSANNFPLKIIMPARGGNIDDMEKLRNLVVQSLFEPRKRRKKK